MQAQMDIICGERNHIWSIPSKPRNYWKHLGVQKTRYYTMLHFVFETLQNTSLAQYSVYNIIQVSGQSLYYTVFNDMQKLYTSTFIKSNKSIISTNNYSNSSLGCLLLLNNNIFNNINGRRCVCGIKNIVYNSK